MNIKDYNGAGTLDMSNILSVAKAFYKGLTYDKEFYPPGMAFRPGCRLSSLETTMRTSIDGKTKYKTELDFWFEKNGKLFNSLNMPDGYTEKDVRYLPTNALGIVNCTDYKTHWLPTICAYDSLGNLRVYNPTVNTWYRLIVARGDEYADNSRNGAFATFVNNLFLEHNNIKEEEI